jgi:flagellar biosynthetic protein FlhB
MAEQDDAEKTEDPSGRKLDRGRRRGQVAQSPEVANWGILMMGALLVVFAAPWTMKHIARVARTFLESPSQISADMAHLQFLFGELALALLAALWPIFLFLVMAALAIHLVQTGLVWAVDRFELDWGRLSPIKGFARLVSLRTLVEFVKGVVKLAVIGGVIFAVALPLLKDVELLPAMSLGAVLDRSEAVVLRVAIAALAILTVIAGFDFVYQRYAFLKQMRMTKHEVKEEHKQAEGDPHVKARIRSLRRERARQRMMAAVPKATVVITNPTHYAVALAYEMEKMEAPKLVAKGADYVALRIREIAEENEVPIVENPPLARALFASVELDEEIPVEHYKAVAEVIGFVMRLKGKLH